MPELTIKMAHNIVKHLNLQEKDTVLDFGCAKGYLVKALRILDIEACGCDISEYAINQIDVDTKDYCWLMTDDKIFKDEIFFDWIISKDVLEHLSESEIDNFLSQATKLTRKMFHVVPLGDGNKFVIPEYQLDITHKLAKTKEWWEEKFSSYGWKVKFYYKLRGIKDNWTDKYDFGNGFFILEK